jgi:hypothetical protein
MLTNVFLGIDNPGSELIFSLVHKEWFEDLRYVEIIYWGRELANEHMQPGGAAMLIGMTNDRRAHILKEFHKEKK